MLLRDSAGRSVEFNGCNPDFEDKLDADIWVM